MTIDQILAQREADASGLYQLLVTTAADEKLPVAYRESETGRLKGELQIVNRRAERELRETLVGAARAPQARIAEGVRYSADEKAEARDLRDQHKDRPGQLMELAATAWARGAVSKARSLFRAAELAGVQTSGRLSRLIADSDPGLVDARSSVRTLQATALALSGDIAREQANVLKAGPQWAAASIHAKSAAMRLGADPNAVQRGPSLRAQLDHLAAPDGRLEPDAPVVEAPPAVVPA